MEFAEGAAKLELSQGDVAKAVEFWLNERILKQRCIVTGLKQANSNQWQSVTFHVKLEEVATEDGEGDGWETANMIADLVNDFPAGHTSNALQAAQEFLVRAEELV